MKQNTLGTIVSQIMVNSQITNEDRELYSYALKVFVQWLLNMSLIVLIGIFMHMLPECLIMLLSFMSLRKFSGGIHAKRFVVCFLSSSVIMVIGLLLIQHKWFVSTIAFEIIVTISAIIICIFSPVKHPNKNISKNEARKFQLISSVISIIELTFTNFFANNPTLQYIGFSLGTGMIICCISLIAGKVEYSAPN